MSVKVNKFQRKKGKTCEERGLDSENEEREENGRADQMEKQRSFVVVRRCLVRSHDRESREKNTFHNYTKHAKTLSLSQSIVQIGLVI